MWFFILSLAYKIFLFHIQGLIYEFLVKKITCNTCDAWHYGSIKYILIPLIIMVVLLINSVGDLKTGILFNVIKFLFKKMAEKRLIL